jgi:hypothetical protein
VYLAKKDDNGQYVEDLKSFAKKVGLRKTAPSAVLDALAPAEAARGRAGGPHAGRLHGDPPVP